MQELLDQAGGLAGIDRGVEEALKNGDFVERDGPHAQQRTGREFGEREDLKGLAEVDRQRERAEAAEPQREEEWVAHSG